MKKHNITFIMVGLLLLAGSMGWSKTKNKRRTIEYAIVEVNKLCDRCGGRGTVSKKDLETTTEFGEDNKATVESCPKCNGTGFLKEEGTGGVDYYSKTVIVISFSPDAKRKKLFASRKYRKRFLDKYFGSDYILVATKETRQADIDKLPKALKKLHYLKLQLTSINRAPVDREKGETKFELIYLPKEKEANSGNAGRVEPQVKDNFDDDFAEDDDSGDAGAGDPGVVKKVKSIFVEEEEEPQRIYLSFRSNRIKKRVLAATKKEIIDTKKKYHLLFD